MAQEEAGCATGEVNDATPHAHLVNEHEAAARLGIKVSTLRRWRWAGQGICFIKIGTSVRYDPQDIRAFIEAGRRSSTSDDGKANTCHSGLAEQVRP